MKLAVVRIKRREGKDGEVSRRETLLDGESFRIGRGRDCEIALPDIAADHHHATASVIDGVFTIESVAKGKLRVGAKEKRRALMAPGVTVSIGDHRLTLEAAPPYADYALAVEQVAGAESKADAGPPQTLAEALPSRRRLAWALTLPILALALGWPVYESLTGVRPGAEAAVVASADAPSTAPSAEAPASPAASAATTVLAAADAAARIEPLTGDLARPGHPAVVAWTSGPISAAHAMIGEDCAACHLAPFEMAPNRGCLACHGDVARHADVAPHPVAGLDDQRCASCHKEHEGGLSPITVGSGDCTVCHADLNDMVALAPMTDLRAVADFGAAHPAFRVSDPTGPKPAWARDGGSTGLRFPHDKHLTGRVSAPLPAPAEALFAAPPAGWSVVEAGGADGPRLRSPEGRLFTADGRADLRCADCHRPEPGGADMLPIEMERDCAWCHQLKVDTLTAVRIVPHAQPDEVIAMIRDYYRARALEGGITAPDAPDYARRRGGDAVLSSGAGQDPAPVAEALEWAASRAEAHIARAFSDERTPVPGQTSYDVGTGLCAYCHVVERTDDAERPWRVLPASVTDLWMPMARFDHAAHLGMDCGSCHEATTSKAATDVLMPAIDNCRDCHKGEAQAAAAPSGCLECHGFHLDGGPPISPPHAALIAARQAATARAATVTP